MTVSSMKSSQGLCQGRRRARGRQVMTAIIHGGGTAERGGRGGREGLAAATWRPLPQRVAAVLGRRGYHKRSAGVSKGSGPEGLLTGVAGRRMVSSVKI